MWPLRGNSCFVGIQRKGAESTLCDRGRVNKSHWVEVTFKPSSAGRREKIVFQDRRSSR